MPHSDILSLQETSADNWTAKYRGNYGIYTIKIRLKDGKVSKFSCSCPSDGYPCKHIAMISSAINEKIAKNNSSSALHNQDNIQKIIKQLPHNELIEFVLEQTKRNEAFANAVLLEFTHKTKKENNDKKYNAIFRKIFEQVTMDEDEYYGYDEYEEGYNLDELDDWLEKAEKHIRNNDFQEAEAIYKACIEEFVSWVNQSGDYAEDYISSDYYDVPFENLMEMADNGQTDAESLFAYCLTEIEKSKYKSTSFLNSFYELMAVTAKSDNQKKKFIDLQYKLFDNESDKKSYKSEQILSRIASFYEANNQKEDAWKVMEDNLQIDKFREIVVREKIKQNKFAEAKKLIHTRPEQTNSFARKVWNEFLLEIALKENDADTIRHIAKSFILRNFDEKYYRIYKSTFSAGEWTEKMEMLIAAYQKESKNLFSYNIGDLLVEEKDEKRLLDYVTRHCSTRTLESYYKHFVKNHPAETLRIFRLSVEDYAKNNLGREHYDYIVKQMKIMQSITGGNEIVSSMKANFKIIYKNRRAMMEILEKIK